MNNKMKRKYYFIKEQKIIVRQDRVLIIGIKEAKQKNKTHKCKLSHEWQQLNLEKALAPIAGQ